MSSFTFPIICLGCGKRGQLEIEKLGTNVISVRSSVPLVSVAGGWNPFCSKCVAEGGTVKIQHAPEPAPRRTKKQIQKVPAPVPLSPVAQHLGAAAKVELVRKNFERLKGSSHHYVALADLRDATPELSRAEFDAALNQLRRDWVLTLSPAEGRHETVEKRLLDAGITEQDRRLVYVDRRES